MPRDAAGFSRRTCPRCELPFKVRAGAREERALAAAIARGAGSVEGAPEVPPRHCPYCGEDDEPEAFLPEDLAGWIAAQARRLAAEVRWWTLRAPLERLGLNPRPTYVPVRHGGEAPPLPREPGDALEGIPLPCCGEEVKVLDTWTGAVRCHYCGYVHSRSVGRDVGMELALLRSGPPAE